MSSSQEPGSPDRPVDRSSHDQDKPATTKRPGLPPHRGWSGYSDPLPRSVITEDDRERIAWHVRQAHANALRAWADDPRGQAWVPEELINVRMSNEDAALFNRDQVVFCVHVPAFLLDAERAPRRVVSATEPLRDRVAEAMYLAWHPNNPWVFAEQTDDVRTRYLLAADALVPLLAERKVRLDASGPGGDAL